MADAGDAVLLQLKSLPDPTASSADEPVAQVWRIPKDGSAHTAVRPDLQWADPQPFPQWLAWDGGNVLGPIVLQNQIVQARVTPAGTSAAQQVRLWGTVATHRGDEILSLQTAGDPVNPTLVVASSKGDPAGSVLGCGDVTSGLASSAPAGIAANDDEVFVAYQAGEDTVIARVQP